MRRIVPKSRGRATGGRYIVLVTLLGLSGAALAVLLTAMATLADPSAVYPGGAGPGRQVTAGPDTQTDPATQVNPDMQTDPASTEPASEVWAGTAQSPEDTTPSQAFGWLYHHEYPLDESGEQVVFGITRDGDGLASIQALGILWNKAAGFDVRFEIPAGLAAPAPLAAGGLSSDREMNEIRTEPVPATFIDLSGSGGSSAHSGTITFLLEGAGDIWEETVIGERFSPYAGGWIADFAADADRWRLALLSVSFDCPDLGIFQVVVSDWETDFVEIFQGSPLQIAIVRQPGLLVIGTDLQKTGLALLADAKN